MLNLSMRVEGASRLSVRGAVAGGGAGKSMCWLLHGLWRVGAPPSEFCVHTGI